MNDDEMKLMEKLVFAIDRLRDEVENHSKVLSKGVHLLEYSLQGIKTAVEQSKE